MFSIKNAVGGYGKTTIINGAFLHLEQGEVVALLGRNGVGKTSLLKYAMGLLRREAGAVELNGAELPSSPSNGLD